MVKFNKFIIFCWLTVVITLTVAAPSVSIEESYEPEDEVTDAYEDEQGKLLSTTATLPREVTADQISPVVSQLVTAIVQPITGALGPLGPVLNNFVTPLATSAITNLAVGAINGLYGLVSNVLRQSDVFPNSDLTTYILRIPNQGSYLLIAKNKMNQVASSPALNPFNVPIPQQKFHKHIKHPYHHLIHKKKHKKPFYLYPLHSPNNSDNDFIQKPQFESNVNSNGQDPSFNDLVEAYNFLINNHKVSTIKESDASFGDYY